MGQYKRAEENDKKILEKELEELRDIFNYEKDLRIKSEKEINRLNNIIDELEKNIKENVERCRVNFNETQDIKWLDYIEIYGCIENELKGDNK